MVRGAAVLLLVVMVAPTAQASTLPVSGLLQSNGPTTFIGTNGFTADADALLAQGPGTGGAMDLILDSPGAVALLVNAPRAVILGPGGAAGTSSPIGMEQEVLRQASVHDLRFVGAPDDSQVRILGDGGPLTLSLAATPTLRAGPGPAVPEGPGFHGVEAVQGHPLRVPVTGWLDSFAAPALAWEQPYVAAFMGGTVRPSPTQPGWATGHSINQTRSHVDPVTGAGLVVFDNVMVLVQGRGATLSWPVGSQAWRIASGSLSGPFHGDVAWTGVQADLRAGGKALAVEPRLLHMRGDLLLHARFEGAGRWSVDGKATFISVDAGLDLAAAAAAAAAGAGILVALLALLSEPGRAGLAFLLGRHGRLTKAAPLRSPSRRRVLDAIHVHQPVRSTELQQVTGLSRTSLAYHLRVLLAYNVVQTSAGTAGGRNVAFVLNSGSLDFAIEPPVVDGEEARAMQALATANSHPVRRSLYQAVRDHGPVDFAGLNALRASRGEPALPQSSATHHLQQLVASGALRAERVGKGKVYSAALHDGAARIEQYRRFLRQIAALDLVRALHRSPLARSQAGGKKRVLRRLCELGLVAYDRDDDVYRVAPLLGPVAGSL